MKKVRKWSDKALSWTDRQREIYDLLEQGKTYQQIVDLGYSKHMISRVLNARTNGIKPPALELEVGGGGEDNGGGIEEGSGDNSGGTEKEGGPKIKETVRPFAQVVGPKTAPIVFLLDQKKIALDPLELQKQYSYFTDIANKDGGIINSFSQVQTLAMQVLWILLQDIPKDENMLRAIFYGVK